MKKFLEPVILLFAGLALSASPLLSPNQVYVLTLYGINTHLRLEYLGWIAIIASAIWIISLLLNNRKKTAVPNEETKTQ